MGLRTDAVHAGEDRSAGGLTTPIHRSSTYELGEPERFDDIRYIRLNNTPNQRSVEAKLSAVLRGEALVTPSGTAAIWLALSGELSRGDELMVSTRIYGGTRKIMEHLAAREGLLLRFVDLETPERWEVSEATRGFYVESIANPWMSVGDLDAVLGFCRQHGLRSYVDNTLMTPVYYHPLEHGFDVELHSASKHLNGHSDLVAGVIATRDAESLDRLRLRANLVGMCPDPEMCALLQRGMKTLPVRVRAQSETSGALAAFLEAHPAVERVYSPSLPSDPSHARAKRLGGFGTMLTFIPKGDAELVMKRFRVATEAPSLGGLETLVTRPVTTSHASLPAEMRAAMGVSPDMIRVSVGLEDFDDLRADFEHALAG